ncbi:MAG: hypothetical protein R3343_06470 [Nitriliruptorales bacterium]|nr:hypothetical protein [Nitriliruptorales bacterium]
MNTLQTWLIIGIPGLVVVAALFSGHSRVRTLLGYLALAALLVTFTLVTGEVYSSAAIGLIGFFLVATGRGTADEDAPEEHENRKRYTTTPSGSSGAG